MIDRFRRFMYGRYGNDSLNRFLTLAACASAVLSWFIFPRFFTFLLYVLLISAIYRCMSRRHADRAAENQRYLELKNKITRKNTYYTSSGYKSNYGSGYGAGAADAAWKKPARDKDHKIFNCPACGQKVRVPRGKGKIMITCPKCGHEFKKRT